MTAALNPHPPQEYARANHFFVVVLWVAFAASLTLAPWHGTWTPALLVGLPAALIPTLLILSASEAAITRIGVGAALMVAGFELQEDDEESLVFAPARRLGARPQAVPV